LDYFGLWELRRIADDLDSLRSQLRLDIRTRLQQIEDIAMFDAVCKTTNAAGIGLTQFDAQMLSVEEKLALQRFTFTFQMVLELSTGHFDTFMTCAVPVEVGGWEELYNLFLAKKNKLFEINNEPEVVAFGESFSQTLGLIRCFSSTETVDLVSTVDYRGRLRISF
jgi:hypothetical protein